MSKKVCLVLFFFTVLLPAKFCRAQGVGVGTNTPHNSTILDIQSNDKGVGFPSMSTAQRNAIASPKAGLIVFDLEKNTLFMYDGAQWLALLFSASTSSLPPISRTAPDGATGDFFGNSVAISGDYAVVGAPGDDIGADADQGSAYVFFRNGAVWTQQAKLTASDGFAGDGFGNSVSISGDYIIVGAPFDNGLFSDHGSAYIFSRNGTNWAQQDHVFAASPAPNDRFGYSVSISGNYAMVGSPNDDVNGNNDQGSAYFFVRSGTSWTQQDHVIAPFGEAHDNFSTSVCIQGDYAIVGAPKDDIGGNADQGSAHIFLRVGTNWSHEATLTSATGIMFEGLGESVSIYGEWAVVGVPNYGTGANPAAGAVYVYHRTGSGWSSGTRIYLPSLGIESNAEDFFGKSVSISDDYLVIGAEGVDIESNEVQGRCYLFKRNNNTWSFVRKITDAGGGGGDVMGGSVGISGFNCIAGAGGAAGMTGKILFLNFE